MTTDPTGSSPDLDVTPTPSPAPRRRGVLRSPALRWAVPVGAVAVVAGGVGLTGMSADAAAQLPPKSAAQLLADVARAEQRPLSGTVVETARLGLPELPGLAGGTSLQSLVTGSHTARVWYGTDGQARVSLVGDLAETDVVHDGRDVWLWSSTTNEARHYQLPAGGEKARTPVGPAPGAAADPASAAKQALAAVDASTAVDVDGTATVAGRSAYELRLTPKDTRSLVGSVRVAVDGATSTPLRVQVFARGAKEPAFETGFTSVQFSRPDASVFRFTPPAGAKVVQGALPTSSVKPDRSATARPKSADGARVVGQGWTSVAVVPGVDLAAVGKDATASAVLRGTTTVSGPFGTGRLLKTALVSVLFVGDTAYVGAVDAAVLQQAAASSSTTR